MTSISARTSDKKVEDAFCYCYAMPTCVRFFVGVTTRFMMYLKCTSSFFDLYALTYVHILFTVAAYLSIIPFLCSRSLPLSLSLDLTI